MYETTEYNLGCLSDSVVHIHGSFHNTTPVLGVDRIDQLNVSYDLSSRGKRTIIKPTFNSEIDNRRISATQNLINVRVGRKSPFRVRQKTPILVKEK